MSVNEELRRLREERSRAFFSQCKPTLINSFFKVYYYNGGCERDDLKVENILQIDINSETQRQHCSKRGRNFDLILEYTGQRDSFSLTHFHMLGCPSCTSPINNGVMVVLRDVPKSDAEIVEWGKQWNDAKKEDIEKWNSSSEDKFIDGKPVYFETSPVFKKYETEFDTLRCGKYLYLKFISGPDRNIDIRQIGIFGLIGDKKNYGSYSPSGENIFSNHSVEINRFREYRIYEYYCRKPCLLVVSKNQNLRTLAKNLTVMDKEIMVYYLPQHISLNTLNVPPGPREFDFGLRFDNIEMKEKVYMFERDTTRGIDRRWKLEEPYTQTRITQFIRDVRENRINEWIREEASPAPTSASGVLTLVRSTFGPTVLGRKCGRPVLISFTHPQFPNFGCENYLEDVKKEYGDRLIVGKYDIKKNDLPLVVTVGCYFYGHDPQERKRPTHFNDISPNPPKEKFLSFVRDMMTKFSESKKENVVVNVPPPSEQPQPQPQQQTTTADPQNTAKITFIQNNVPENQGIDVIPTTTTSDQPPPPSQQQLPSSSVVRRDGDRISIQGFTLIFQHRIHPPPDFTVDNTFHVEMTSKRRTNQEVMNVIRANKNTNIPHMEILKIRKELSAEYIELAIVGDNNEIKRGRIVMNHNSMSHLEETVWPEIMKAVLGDNVKEEEEEMLKMVELLMLDNEKKSKYGHVGPYFVAFVPIITASQNLVLQFRVGEDGGELTQHLVNQFMEFVKNMFLD